VSQEEPPAFRKAPIKLPTEDDSVFTNQNTYTAPVTHPSPPRAREPSPPPARREPSPVRQPSPPPREPSPPPRQPSPPPVREPSPPRREPSPVAQQPVIITETNDLPRARNLLAQGLPPRQNSDDDEEETDDWGDGMQYFYPSCFYSSQVELNSGF